MTDHTPEATLISGAAALQEARPAGGRELVLLFDDVASYDTLLSAMPPEVDVRLLSSQGDGLAAMAAAAAAASPGGWSAIHVISHGRDGLLSLGSMEIDAASLASSSQQALWRQIGRTLSADGDLLLYGCRVGRDGAFIEQLAALTQADVAASTDDTGASALGGNTTLEVSTGTVAASNAVARVLSDYNGLLAAIAEQTVTSSPSLSGSGSVFNSGTFAVTYGNGVTPTSTERLSLQRSTTAATGPGDISVVANTIYKGDGSTARPIGTIDDTLGGLNGASLLVNFTGARFENPSFDGTLGPAEQGSPTLLGVYAPTSSSLRLVYDRPLSTSASSRPSSTAFTISGSTARTVSSISLTAPNLVTLTLSNSLAAGETIGIAYTPPWLPRTWATWPREHQRHRRRQLHHQPDLPQRHRHHSTAAAGSDHRCDRPVSLRSV